MSQEIHLSLRCPAAFNKQSEVCRRHARDTCISLQKRKHTTAWAFSRHRGDCRGILLCAFLAEQCSRGGVSSVCDASLGSVRVMNERSMYGACFFPSSWEKKRRHTGWLCIYMASTCIYFGDCGEGRENDSTAHEAG